MKKQTGYSLVELMIALLIGLVIVAATISVYLTTVKGSSDTIKAARLNHDLEAVMTLMINDIRRAGYWGGATAGSDAKDNPFTNTATANIQMPSASCILYTYDSDADGVIDANEYYGFKQDGTTIRMRFSGTTTADCSNGNWQEYIAGDQITITGLSFTTAYKCLNTDTAVSYNKACSACTTGPTGELPSGNTAVESREIHITLSGKLTADPTVTKKLENVVVKVRNDRIFTQP